MRRRARRNRATRASTSGRPACEGAGPRELGEHDLASLTRQLDANSGSGARSGHSTRPRSPIRQTPPRPPVRGHRSTTPTPGLALRAPDRVGSALPPSSPAAIAYPEDRAGPEQGIFVRSEWTRRGLTLRLTETSDPASVVGGHARRAGAGRESSARAGLQGLGRLRGVAEVFGPLRSGHRQGPRRRCHGLARDDCRFHTPISSSTLGTADLISSRAVI